MFSHIVAEIPFVILGLGVVTVGLWLSNVLYDLNVPHYLSRKFGHAAGGLTFLIAALFLSSAFLPIVLSAIFTFILLAARFLKPAAFRGVGGSARNQAHSEIWFAAVPIPVFSITWLWLNQPYVAATCLLFMAWGDCLTGIVRSQIYAREGKGLWGSLAMLAVCLVISLAFIHPFWIGAVGSVVAVAAETIFGSVGFIRWGDDNWAIPLFSMGTILGLMSFTSNLA